MSKLDKAQIGNFTQTPHAMIKRRREKKVEKPIHSAPNGDLLGDGGAAITVFQHKRYFMLCNFTLI